MTSTPRVALLLTALLAGAFAVAQETAAPTAEAILDANAAAMGGAAAYARIRTSVVRGTLEMVGMGISGSVTLYSARPASSMVLFEAEALGKIRSGTDGRLAWELSDLQGPRLLEGAERAYALRSALFDAPVRWRELYPKVELLGSEAVDGAPCWKLRLQPSDGDPETWYVDQTSHLLVKATMTLTHAMGEIPVECTFGDYRPVDGVLLPFRSTQKMLTQEMRTVVSSVETNVEIPAAVFALPAEVRALLSPPAPGPSPTPAATAGGVRG
jgi:hypothetical protein